MASEGALIDTSVFAGHWPFRALRARTAGELKERLLGGGVTQAWLAATEAILFPDPMEANEPLFQEIRGDSFYVPVAIINPTLATWREDAGACLERWGCGAFKLVPSYHQYSLEDLCVDEMVELAMDADVPLCIQLLMMDPRSQHPLMKVQAPGAAEIARIGKRHPQARILVCGATRGEVAAVAGAPNAWVETSLVEEAQTLSWVVGRLGPGRVVFGSHSPFQYFTAMAAKLDVDTVDVPPDVVERVRFRNALALLDGEEKET